MTLKLTFEDLPPLEEECWCDLVMRQWKNKAGTMIDCTDCNEKHKVLTEFGEVVMNLVRGWKDKKR